MNKSFEEHIRTAHGTPYVERILLVRALKSKCDLGEMLLFF